MTQLLASMHEHELESYFGDTVSQIRARVCEDAKKVFADKGLSDKIRYHETSSELDDESQDLVMANYLVTNVRFIHPFLHEWQRLLHRDGNLLIIDHGCCL